MKKITVCYLLAAIASFSFASCSKTRDGLGLDTIRNNARAGKWEVTHQIYLGSSSEPTTSNNLTEGAAYAEFKSDNKVHFYNSSGVENPADAKTYSFLDTKSILYGGDEFKIQENLAGSFAKMTLQRSTATGREVYIFQR
ncbi:hypothetical protein [Niabella hibiscisoli]|uniref:hypothetical protein n=1 Tax=Niabella hibiscisoli TaxID=1825928 RepID=UPI001F0E2CA5|nr:hypothetical protein [Niabella hibiscisoli]MCH5716958.1 hypothetical protein [Niabella hibiscisoli]